MGQFDKLFEPGKIGKMQLKNRIIFAPLVTTLATEAGEVSERQIEYYAERARGGAGLIVVEASYPRESGYPTRIMLRTDSVIHNLKKLVEAVHHEGAKIICEINTHRGRQDEYDPASPSDVPNPFTGRKPRPMSIPEIKKLEDDFCKGVSRVKEAGFDGVMIHGSTGYLVSEFLSPLINHRTDDYGGSPERRSRFAIELVQVTRAIVGPDYPIIFRLAADERVEGGFRVKDAIFTSKLLQDNGVDAIDVTVGGAETFEWTAPSMYLPPGCNIYAAKAIKEEIKIPVSVAGRLNDPYLADKVLRDGSADFVSIGRGLVADPYLPQKAREGRINDICQCIACLQCTLSLEHKTPISCATNPAVGREKEFEQKLKPASEKKRVLIIGGGPAGMEAAIIAAQKKHDVTLWEASDKLGGQLNLAAVPPNKGDIGKFKNYLITRLNEHKVKVELQKEVSPAAVEAFAADVVVIATGSKPFCPDIKGVRNENVLDSSQVLSGEKIPGNKIVIIGGGYKGCETADLLCENGKDVTVVFRSSEPAKDIKIRNIKKLLLKRLSGKVKMLPGVREYVEIKPQSLELVDKEGQVQIIKTDSIVLATGSTPDHSLAVSLKGKVPRIYEIGDCVEARGIFEAIHEGAEAALKI